MVAVEEATPSVPLASDHAARENTFTGAKSLPPMLSADVTANGLEHLTCPSCGHREMELDMLQHFKQDHRNEDPKLDYVLEIGKLRTQLRVFVKLSKFPFRPFEMDNRYVSFHNRWPWEGTDFDFSVRFVAEDYVSGFEKAVIEDVRKLFDVLYSLLRKIRPHFGWESDTEIEHIFVKIDTLWKLCMSSNALLIARHTQHWLSSLANALNSTANEHRLSNVVTMFNQALMFAEEVRTKYLNELNELIQCMASLNFLSAQLPFSTLILQDLPE